MTRPSSLDPLFRSLRGFKGVGPRFAPLLAKLLGTAEGQDATALDLLMHMPAATIDRSRRVGIAEAYLDQVVTLRVHVDRHEPAPRGKASVPHRVHAHDETGDLQLVFFRAQGGWVEQMLPVGEERIVSGRIGFFNGTKQITHPDYVVPLDKADTLPLIEPLYPLTHGLSSKQLHKLVQSVLDTLPGLPEWIEPERLKANGWPDFATAMRAVHAPQQPQDAEPWGPARMRLAHDEYLAGQLALQLVRATREVPRGKARILNGVLTHSVRTALPFALTDGQEQAIAEILGDLSGPQRMSRLVQGDVGSGKTVVALMAMAAVAESGGQSALMAPTELLAGQHFRTLAPLCEAAGLRIALLTGKMSAGERRNVREGLASGEIAIAVGTHALFQADVAFADLALTVVDEQHRFGVHQRLALSDKGRDTDLLVMTATPIPRTLVLTHYGDMAVSVLREKPRGRQPIDTAALPIGEYDRVVARLKARIAEGAQAYWVCPLVEESEAINVMSAQDRFAALQPVFGERVGLLHGRMSAAAKQEVMDRFKAGDIAILIATTVVEVGVDVPNATIIAIEHAERFGLAQLHQLRGRVGRGSARSACLLLFRDPLGEVARARLDTLRETQDGFVIAERDLELRGQGDLLGTRQSGMPGYRLAIPDVHRHLLEPAHDDAVAALAAHPGLEDPAAEKLRILLHIFRKDVAIQLIRAG